MTVKVKLSVIVMPVFPSPPSLHIPSSPIIHHHHRRCRFLTAVFDDSQLMGENAHDAHTHGHPVPAHGIPGGGAGASGSGSGASTPGGAGSGSDSPVVKVAKSGAAKSKTQSVSTIASKFKAQLGAYFFLAVPCHRPMCVRWCCSVVG